MYLRLHATKERVIMTNTFHIDSVDTVLTPAALVLTLQLKAKEYLDGLMLDTGLKVDAKVLRKL